ncbi:MAG: sel1 repeat family protein [Gemmatimonadota bacterium]|nr:sel1 repeat family protein [Gemmatimonadota bacterium]
MSGTGPWERHFGPHGLTAAILVLSTSPLACGPPESARAPADGASTGSQVDSPDPALPDSTLLLAVDWYTGVAGSVDDEEARSLLEESAADGDPISIMWIARVHSRGRMGFPQDTARARQLATGVVDAIERSARARVPEAMFLMGTAFDEGLGRSVDPEEAVEWYRRAAEAGHILAAHNLGNALSAGRGVPEDPAGAVRWWRAAAEAGDAITQLRLGEAYEAGRGVPSDLDSARVWYGRSAATGNRQAREALARLGAALERR